jgi:hypothetical protein
LLDVFCEYSKTRHECVQATESNFDTVSRTEADPTLLADYVAALLKNHKSRKELQTLCVDQLYDFLGEGQFMVLS